MKVKSHLALIATAILVPVAIISAFVLHTMLTAERESALRSMHELARATVLAVDQEITYSLATAKALSTSQRLADGDFLGFYLQATAANAGRQNYTALINGDGEQIFNTITRFGAPTKAPEAENRERVRTAIRKNSPQISDLIIGTRTGKPVLSVEIPIRLNDGRDYVISEWMFANYLTSVLPKNNVPSSWLITYFDKNGITIASNRKPDEFIGNKPRDGLLKHIFAGTTTHFITANREGEEMYGVISKSSLTGWTAVVGVPVNEIEQAARRSVAAIALGIFVALGGAAFAALILARRLIRATDQAKLAAMLLGKSEVPAVMKSGVDEMDELHHSLHSAGRILQRSEQLRNQLLTESQQARAVAEAQNKAKDEFLAMLGHELRNPLAAISSGVQILNHGGSSPEMRQRAQVIIDRQSQQLSHLVDELLDTQRVISGKVTLSKKIVKLNEVVRNCLDAIQTRGATQNRTVSISTEPLTIEADPARLEQMVGNLLENAFKYTPEGGAVEIKALQEGPSVVLTIRDSGIGISPDLLPRVFDLFFQGPVTNRSKGGLGVGLAVVKSLTEQHGATISVQSEGAGHGSTFTLRFPIANTAHSDFFQLTPSHIAPTAESTTILVIEDIEDAREALCSMLHLYGFKVSSVASGTAGIDKVTKELPDVALVDIDLPDMSGYDIARRLRANKETKGITLIAVTGYGQESDRQTALNSGFDYHVKKPANLNELLVILRKDTDKRA